MADAYQEHVKRLRAEGDHADEQVTSVDLGERGIIFSDGMFVLWPPDRRRPEHDQVDPLRERPPGPTLKGWKAGDR